MKHTKIGFGGGKVGGKNFTQIWHIANRLGIEAILTPNGILLMTHVKVVTPAQKYKLLNMEDPQGTEPQEVRFINKEKVDEEGEELRTVYNGTTNEAVLEMMIHRLSTLYQKLPSEGTAVAIDCLQEAKAALEFRTKDREERGVEGTHKE